MQKIWLVALMAVAGCVQPVAYPAPTAAYPTPAVQPAAGKLPPEAAARNFLTVVARVEPVAESYCRRAATAQNCDFQIVIDDRPGEAPNAFQTLDRQGRPIIALSLALIADARNPDEIAFVLGHEAAHHIAGHIPRQQQTAATGAVLAGIVAAASGGGQAEVDRAQQIGAGVAARSYSKDYELQADAIGAEIAWHAGYDPLLGAAFFDRLPDPGDQFLGSHPANSQRKAVVARVVASLRGY